MTRARQLSALGLLSWRSLTRRALRDGKPEMGTGATIKRLLLTGTMVMSSTYIFSRQAYLLSQARHGRVTSTSLFLSAWLLLTLAFVAKLEAAPLRQRLPVGFTNPALLDPLPISLFNRLAFQLGPLEAVLGMLVVIFYCLAPERFPGEWLALTALALVFLLALVLAAKLVSLALRVALPPNWARRALNLVAGAATLVGMVLVWSSFFPRLDVGARPRLAVFVPLFRPLALLLASREGGTYAFNLLVLGLVGFVSYGLIGLLDRIGYDRGLGAASGAHTPTRARLDPRRVERLLLRRQQGLMLWWIAVALGFGGSLWLARNLAAGDAGALRLAHLLPTAVAYFACLYSLRQARGQAHRDRDARPLLASLPISPADTLESKTRALWLLSLAPLLVLLIPPLIATHFEGELLWRSGVAAVGLWLVGRALVPIAFFNAGAGTSSGAGGGFLDELLILLPLFGALAAPTPLTELPSLGALALVAWEARRAAALHVRWLDDAGDDLERETPVWRALLVFAVFAAIEEFAQLFLGWTSFAANLPSGTPVAETLSVSYLVASAALILLTLNGRDGLPALSWLGARRWFIPAGAVAGAAAGVVAVAYGHLVDRWGVDPGPLSIAWENAGAAGRALLASVVIALAPVAEELFFRGWLQQAVKVELPARWKRYAFVLAAFVFASIHPGAAFPPVFLLGLVAGLLYELSGGILAGILAHAAYNAVVTFVSL